MRSTIPFLPLLVLGVMFTSCPSSLSAAPPAGESPIRHVQQRIVKIYGAGGLKRLYGYSTGFLVTPQGHIVTIWSTVLDNDDVTVILDDGRKFAAKVVGSEPQLDVAVLKIEAEGIELPHFTEEEFATAPVGGRIYGFSNMFKVATGDEPVSVLHGVVAAKTNLKARRGAFQVPYTGPVYIVDAITNNPGAGGGIITDRQGKLLGMIGKEVRNTQSNVWINYAIPIEELKEVYTSIIEGRYIPVERKGEGDQLPTYLASEFGLIMVPDVVYRTPAYIDVVATGSLAEKAGLRSGDLVLFINNQLVQSIKTFERELGFLDIGDDVNLVVRRGSKLVNVSMIAPKKPEPNEE